MALQNKTAQKHLDATRSGTVTRGNVIGLRKLINASERKARGWSIGVTASAVSLDDLWTVEQALGENRPTVTGELDASGRKLLASPRYAKRFSEAQRDAIARIDHFRLVRFDRICADGTHCVPVYEVWARDAMGFLYNAFAFRHVPWQSGGDEPEIVPSEEG